MSEPQLRDEPRMDDAFRARMRQGLSSMAVRERMRERRRNRAIAGGAVAAVVVATFAVVGAQALAGLQPERDRAAPPMPTHSTIQTPAETPEPTEPVETTPAPEPPEHTPPPGLEGAAAGQPTVTDVRSCSECGDTGAGGGDPAESHFDVYLLCEGRGTVRFGGEVWADCGDHRAGTGFVEHGVADWYDDGDPRFTTSDDFDGQLSVVEPGAPATGASPGVTATVWVTCSAPEGTVTVGGVLFDCSAPVPPEGETLVGSTLAAWGVPIEPGLFAPRIDIGANAVVSVSYVVDR